MTDWAGTSLPSPTHINTYSRLAAGGRGRVTLAMGTPAAATWVSGLAIYIPLFLPFPYLVQRIFWVNGSTITSTNVDCGVYSIDGTLLISTGSTAMAGASAIQYATVTATLLTPGRYYLAWTCDNTTSRAFATTLAAADGKLMGLQQESSAFPLPATITPVTYAGQGMPFCGITRTSSGF